MTRRTRPAGTTIRQSDSPSGASVESKPIQQAQNWTLATQTERAFQASVIRYARLMGWREYHTRDSRGSQAGFPDLVLIRRPRVVWAELKSERGRLSDDQRAWIEELRACGQTAFVWRPSSWQEVERVLR